MRDARTRGISGQNRAHSGGYCSRVDLRLMVSMVALLSTLRSPRGLVRVSRIRQLGWEANFSIWDGLEAVNAEYAARTAAAEVVA